MVGRHLRLLGRHDDEAVRRHARQKALPDVDGVGRAVAPNDDGMRDAPLAVFGGGRAENGDRVRATVGVGSETAVARVARGDRGTKAAVFRRVVRQRREGRARTRRCVSAHPRRRRRDVGCSIHRRSRIDGRAGAAAFSGCAAGSRGTAFSGAAAGSRRATGSARRAGAAAASRCHPCRSHRCHRSCLRCHRSCLRCRRLCLRCRRRSSLRSRRYRRIHRWYRFLRFRRSRSSRRFLHRLIPLCRLGSSSLTNHWKNNWPRRKRQPRDTRRAIVFFAFSLRLWPRVRGLELHHSHRAPLAPERSAGLAA